MIKTTGPRPQPLRRIVIAVVLVGTIPSPGIAAAASNCMARILADVPAEEAPEQMKSKSNGTFGPITQIKVDKTSGRMVYCAKGSYCYNSNAFELTTPCRLKLDKASSTGSYFSYFTR